MDRTGSASRRREETAAGCSGGAKAAAVRRPRGWTAVAFIIGVFAAISLATSVPLASYLINRYNMKANAATNVANVYAGTSSFSPVVGAFVADAYWGRFRTLLFGIVVGIAAMVVITLSATIRQLRPPPCTTDQVAGAACAGATGLQRAVLYVGMGLLVVSMGGTNPTSLPFGADQFEGRHQDRLKRYYNWYYAVVMAATFLALTVVVYVQDRVSWGLGFGVPTALMLATFVVFLAGTPLYVRVPPEGARTFSSVVRVVVASCRKWKLRLPHPDDARQQEAVLYNDDVVPRAPSASGNGGAADRVSIKLPLTLQLGFLNKAAIVTDADKMRPDGSPARQWNLCSVQEVEEVKCLVKVVPIWISGVMWFIVTVELTNYTFIQALTMDLRMGKSFNVPPVSIIAIFYLSIALAVPIYDLLVFRMRRAVTLLQRQGAGVAIGALALVIAAAVERRRRDYYFALENGGNRSPPPSVFLLAPQLVVMGASGACSMVGQMEFYNTQFPEQMRTLGNAAFYCAQGASNYLATLVVSVVNARTRTRRRAGGWVSDDINAGRLDYFYYAMAVFGAANFVYFLLCSHCYRYKQGEEQLAGSDAVSPTLPSCTGDTETVL